MVLGQEFLADKQFLFPTGDPDTRNCLHLCTAVFGKTARVVTLHEVGNSMSPQAMNVISSEYSTNG